MSRPVLASSVEYNLPYPGVLPDSPLYILKVFRDNLVTQFMFDQKQKAFYQLFLSDKRLAAAQALMVNKKTDIAVSTVVKGEEYYRQAVDLAIKVRDQGLTEKLAVSAQKHEDVISDLETKVSGSANDKLNLAFVSNQKAKNRVLELLITK